MWNKCWEGWLHPPYVIFKEKYFLLILPAWFIHLLVYDFLVATQFFNYLFNPLSWSTYTLDAML